ncbi:mitochondrial dicarboxylate transporter [Aspergillus niger]|nr:mitochondrial dicarboxylate transporter [Aspergillus niger]
MGLSRPAEKLPNSYGLACELFSVLGGNSSTECISRITPSEAIFDGGAPRVSKDSEKGYLKYVHYRGLPLGLRLPAGNRDSDWSWLSQTAYYSLYCVRLDFIIIVAFIIPSLVQLRNLPSSPLSTPPFSLSPSPGFLFPPLKCLLWPAARSWRRRILPRRRMLQPLQKKFIILSGSVVQHHALRLPLLTLWISVRLQTRGPGAPSTMVGTFVHVFKNDGFFGLYSGLSAAILRQLTYSTTRFGIYEELKNHFTSPDSPPGLFTLIGMASASGFIGGMAGNPADVLNVRMQSDAALPPAQRRNYRNAIHGLVTMTRTEGPASLFRGVWPNSTRAVLMTTSQLASYDTFKRLCLENLGMSDNMGTHFTASFMAGFVATTVCSPVDVIKTRVMTASPAEGRSQSIVGLLRDITRKEGLAWAFRGWVPSFIRLGPHTIATFIFLEEHKKLYRLLKGL